MTTKNAREFLKELPHIKNQSCNNLIQVLSIYEKYLEKKQDKRKDLQQAVEAFKEIKTSSFVDRLNKLLSKRGVYLPSNVILGLLKGTSTDESNPQLPYGRQVESLKSSVKLVYPLWGVSDQEQAMKQKIEDAKRRIQKFFADELAKGIEFTARPINGGIVIQGDVKLLDLPESVRNQFDNQFNQQLCELLNWNPENLKD